MGNTIHRVYESLKKQTFRDFEWIIVDDGSTDNTQKLVLKWQEEADFKIRYFFQENSGMHVARNRALEVADGELFSKVDADDRFLENALDVFYNTWQEIRHKERYSGIACPALDSRTGQIIGKKFPKEIFDSNDLEVKYIYKLTGDMWGTCRTKVLKEFPFPEIKGQKYFLLSYVWNQVAKKYIHRYINIPLLVYYRDTPNSLSKVSKNFRYPLTHYEALLLEINITYEYLLYDKKLLAWKFINLARFNIHSNISMFDALKRLNSKTKKIMFVCIFPLSIIYAIRDRLKGRLSAIE